MNATLIAPEVQTPVDAVEVACNRVPPLWPLQNFVAVNPFLGLTGRPFTDAARLMEKTGHTGIYLESEYYLDQIRSGAIRPADVATALARIPNAPSPADGLTWLIENLEKIRPMHQIFTVADSLDDETGSNWAALVTDEISKWCSSYFDRGQSAWTMPWRDLPLYEAWRKAAELDANPEFLGLPRFREFVRALPDTAEETIAEALDRLQIPAEKTADFLHRQLMTIFGWSAYAAYEDRQTGARRVLPEMLAIRLAYDAALAALLPNWKYTEVPGSAGPDPRHVALLALENAYRSRLTQQIRNNAAPAASERKALQAVFCIDVRSEVFRRALEAQSPSIQTIGFAGFFGMSIALEESARCPVLLSPKHTVHAPQNDRKTGRAATAWRSLFTSASACFQAVEVAGPWFGVKILSQLFKSGQPTATAQKLHWHISLPERIEMAAGALKNMSLRAEQLAPVVLICGHGSQTENNPYGSSLDCGACGGHKGDVNARFAAAILNDPAVREGLAQRGLAIPSDTVFLAGMHITTTDDVVLFDAENVPVPQRKAIENWLQSAAHGARRERARSLSITASSDAAIESQTRKRSADWSEVRPEWGLAGNAAFIAAPRARTQGVPLHGRTFLHDYDHTLDTDNSVLTLILTAPVVVASWINLQYYGSTVNNSLFGSGNKVIHNVVGAFGVWEGNGGDLRAGLPLQSLHDGLQWRHEPLRLQVFVEAPRERIEAVLQQNESIRELVENEWIYLTAIEGSTMFNRRGNSRWTVQQ